MQKMEARYPQQGELRRDQLTTRNPLKAHAVYWCCFKVLGVYGKVKYCLEIEGMTENLRLPYLSPLFWTQGAPAQLWAEKMALKTGWLSESLHNEC